MTNNPGKRQPNDFLTLYRQYAQAPMRALFLYTSEDDETLGTYLRAYHAELDRMSGEQCLIYQPKTLQSYEEDGIDIVKDPIPGVRPPGLTFESMPALLLWDKRDTFVYSLPFAQIWR